MIRDENGPGPIVKKGGFGCEVGLNLSRGSASFSPISKGVALSL